MVGFSKKEPKPYVVVSFDTTTDALSLNSIAASYGLTGRLIPIPRQLSAGCGMAWREPACNAEKIQEAISKEDIDFDTMIHLNQ